MGPALTDLWLLAGDRGRSLLSFVFCVPSAWRVLGSFYGTIAGTCCLLHGCRLGGEDGMMEQLGEELGGGLIGLGWDWMESLYSTLLYL